MVIRSQSPWQGCVSLVSALITGLTMYCANSSTTSWPKVRMKRPSQYRSMMRAVSRIGSPRLVCIWSGLI